MAQKLQKNLGQPVKNRFKVPKKQWDKWTNHAKGVFNKVYWAMRPSMQWVFSHPKMLPMPREYWDTVRWNVAWTAADAADGQRAPSQYTVSNIHLPTNKQKGLRHGKK